MKVSSLAVVLTVPASTVIGVWLGLQFAQGVIRWQLRRSQRRWRV